MTSGVAKSAYAGRCRTAIQRMARLAGKKEVVRAEGVAPLTGLEPGGFSCEPRLLPPATVLSIGIPFCGLGLSPSPRIIQDLGPARLKTFPLDRVGLEIATVRRSPRGWHSSHSNKTLDTSLLKSNKPDDHHYEFLAQTGSQAETYRDVPFPTS